jgi:hypothetical protein
MKRKLIALLAVVVAFLSCAIVVVANSRGHSRAEALAAEAKRLADKNATEAEQARKAADDRLEALNRENTDLKKLLDSAKADAAKQTDKLASLDKETVKLRADLEAALRQVASLTQKYTDALDAQRKAELAAAARKEAVVQPTVVDPPVVRGGNKAQGNKKRRGSVASLPRTTPNFSELDRNGDGKLSLSEFKAGFPGLDDPEGTFKSLDTDGDGYLSLDEYKAGIPDPPVVHVQKKKRN